MKRTRPLKSSVTFRHSVSVTARVPKLHLFKSLKSLDQNRLSQGTATIEIGFLEGSCCKKMVRANLRNGMVTGFEIDSCESSQPASPELTALVKATRRKLLAKAGGKWKPIPFQKLPQAVDDIIIYGGCVQICVFGRCLTCCANEDGVGCTTDPIYIGPLTTK